MVSWVRSNAPAREVLRDAQQVLSAVDPRLPAYQTRSLGDTLSASLAQRRFGERRDVLLEPPPHRLFRQPDRLRIVPAEERGELRPRRVDAERLRRDAVHETRELDLGPEQQMVLELRPSHDPTKPYGFVGVVVSTKDLTASVWRWNRADDGNWSVHKVIEIPPEPADPADLPPALKPFNAVPPLVSDIELSLDDKFLYVSCWGTGELRQYDVSDPMNPRLTSSVRLGGIVRHAPHEKAGELNGGPQMVEVSRDGRRVYLTNSLYASWDAQFYPEGIRGWMTKIDVKPEGGIAVDPDFFVGFEGERPHQVRLEGGDASSDSYCYP